MGPNSPLRSQKSHFGLIFSEMVEMLKTINEENRLFSPITAPRLPTFSPQEIFSYLPINQAISYFWSQNYYFFYKLMYAGSKNIFLNM